MADVEVRLDLAELKKLLESEGGDVARDLERRALRVEAAAKRYCPVDTGRLRSSITHAMSRDGDGLFVDIGTNVEYGVFVELGTRRSPAQPYLRPALDAGRG